MTFFIPKGDSDTYDLTECYTITSSKIKTTKDFYYQECSYIMEIPVASFMLLKPYDNNSNFNFLIVNDDVDNLYIDDISSRMTLCKIIEFTNESIIKVKCEFKIYDLEQLDDCITIIRNIRINNLLK